MKPEQGTGMTYDSADRQPEQERASQPIRTGLSGGFFSPGSDRSGPLNDAVFLVDEDTFRSTMPKVTHWSVAWSDLMMTMFILFLSLFVYQAAHQDFLVSDENEVIGGDTADALQTDFPSPTDVPFVPIKQASLLTTVGTVKKVEPVQLQDIDVDAVFLDRRTGETDRQVEPSALTAPAPDRKPDADSAAAPLAPAESEETTDVSSPADRAQPAPGTAGHDFTVDKQQLERLNLNEFATVNLVPDNTMRIILTGDLLFASGKAELSRGAITSLRRIAGVIRHTPYMINVVGHTDNTPMHSARYETNWELSVARASRVARFLIEDMGMEPNQFIVSGYGAQRPVQPNSNNDGRAANRRVEIIISKKLPAPVDGARHDITEPNPTS